MLLVSFEKKKKKKEKTDRLGKKANLIHEQI